MGRGEKVQVDSSLHVPKIILQPYKKRPVNGTLVNLKNYPCG